MNTRDDVLSFILADPALAALVKDVQPRLDDDAGHDFDHCLRVALWTVRLGESAGVDVREAITAAFLHDIVNLPKDSPERSQASVRSAALAREILPRFAFDDDAVARVADAIRDHSYSRGAVPESALGKALQDADRLEAVGVLGVFRTVTCGVRMGARYFHADDPWAEHRVLDDARYTLDHFFEKLLKLEDTLHTDAGRNEARRRTDFMRAALRQLGDEIGVPPPAHPLLDR
jgi:uncharacterized protein